MRCVCPWDPTRTADDDPSTVAIGASAPVDGVLPWVVFVRPRYDREFVGGGAHVAGTASAHAGGDGPGNLSVGDDDLHAPYEVAEPATVAAVVVKRALFDLSAVKSREYVLRPATPPASASALEQSPRRATRGGLPSTTDRPAVAEGAAFDGAFLPTRSQPDEAAPLVAETAPAAQRADLAAPRRATSPPNVVAPGTPATSKKGERS